MSAALLLYCRAGFEGECAQEIDARAHAAKISGKARFDSGTGFVVFSASQIIPLSPDTVGGEGWGEGAAPYVDRTPLKVRTHPPHPALSPIASDEGEGARSFRWRDLIFARQCLVAFAHLSGLPRNDRLTSILAALRERGEAFNEVWAEAPDSDAGKQLAPLCKSFGNALVGALKKANLLDASAPRRLHVFFPQGCEVYLCAADPKSCAPWPQGIPRLKFPREAPSRSTLKLEEAFLTLLDDGERARWLKAGMTAVDLGAAPGGWTYELVRRSIRVTAVDNGPMDRALLDSGLVAHRREDGFRFRPNKPVDWLVCDMVEQPRRVAELIAHWLDQRWCRHAIFNLKLPMKKRFDEARQCLARVRATANVVRAKQLYHDREEITVFALSAR